MIVVTGATGTIGRPLLGILVRESVPVRAVSRDLQAAGLPAGVENVAGDPSRPGTIAGYLDGVTTVFLHPRAVGEAAEELLALAKERSVARVVALSAINLDDDTTQQPSRFPGDRNKEAEEAAVAGGLDWTGSASGRPPSDDVEQVLGRPARTYAEWVTDHTAAFQH
ncbi:SDR family oxidoreductase [Dactylosporangium sp. McL0621]|uniref:SDR family oxidoreductase n=1 Tax=Dactylosporangium sp. McL0621 TaxID=3415678 RepID=UPI003CF68C93